MLSKVEKNKPIFNKNRFYKVMLLALALSIASTFTLTFKNKTIIENIFYDYLIRIKNILVEDKTDFNDKIVIINLDNDSFYNRGLGLTESFGYEYYAEIINKLVKSKIKVIALDRMLPSISPFNSKLNKAPIFYDALDSAVKNQIPVITGVLWLNGDVLLPSRDYISLLGNENFGFLNTNVYGTGLIRYEPLIWPYAANDDMVGYHSWSFLVASAVKELDTSLDAIYLDSTFGRISYPSFNFYDVYTKAIENDEEFFERNFKDRLVLIGTKGLYNSNLKAAPGTGVFKVSGLDGSYSFLEFSAYMISTLISGKYLKTFPIYINFFIIFCFTFLSLIPMSFLKRRGSHILYWLPSLFLFIYPFICLLFFINDIYLPYFQVFINLLVVQISYFIIRFLDANFENKVSKEALNLYLTPELANEIVRNPSGLKRGGQREEITVFFSDLVGFTRMGELMSPEDLMDLVNRYYDFMTRAVEHYNGILNHYYGDAIMAIWGDNHESKNNHATLACLSALAQQKFLKKFNELLQTEGKVPLKALMGVSTGQAVVGNLGAANRINYTALGDTVNLASRLVAVNKEYSTSILATEQTYKMAANDIEFRFMGITTVQGREGSLKIYEVMAETGQLKENVLQCRDLFELGVNEYLAKNFNKAFDYFTAASKCMPNDETSKIFINKCLTALKQSK